MSGPGLGAYLVVGALLFGIGVAGAIAGGATLVLGILPQPLLSLVTQASLLLAR